MSDKIIKLDEKKKERVRKAFKILLNEIDCMDEFEEDEDEIAEILEDFLQKINKKANFKFSLSNGNSFSIDKKTLQLIKDEISPLPSYLKISQTHQTNALKGAFSSIKKGRVKDENYKESTRSLGKETYYTLEYSTVEGEKKQYKTAIAIKDLPTVKLAIKDSLFCKFFTFINYQFNVHNTCLFQFDTKLFIEFLGKNPTRNVIEKTNAKLNQYCEAVLPSIKLKWSRMGNQSDTITPFARTSVKKSIVTISLEASYADTLKNSFYEVPREIGQLSENAFLIADYIFTYARQCKKDKFNLTNETLYKKTTLPTYEEVKNSSAYKRDTNKAIKEPYYKALREIQDKLDHKLVLKEEMLDSTNWDSFKLSKTSFQIIDYKDTVNAIQKAQDKKIRQSKTKKTTKNKKP